MYNDFAYYTSPSPPIATHVIENETESAEFLSYHGLA